MRCSGNEMPMMAATLVATQKWGAMTEVSSSIDIGVSASRVFGYIADMSNNTVWQRGQQSCEWTSPPPIGVGSTYDQIARFLGRSIVSAFEVVEFEPDRLIRIVTTSGTMPIDVTRTVEALDSNRCRVSALVKGEPPGPMRLLGPLLDRMVAASVRGDYRRLKDVLEG